VLVRSRLKIPIVLTGTVRKFPRSSERRPDRRDRGIAIYERIDLLMVSKLDSAGGRYLRRGAHALAISTILPGHHAGFPRCDRPQGRGAERGFLSPLAAVPAAERTVALFWFGSDDLVTAVLGDRYEAREHRWRFSALHRVGFLNYLLWYASSGLSRAPKAADSRASLALNVG
jgi:hypothetical protein